jgi:hypothetical protein
MIIYVPDPIPNDDRFGLLVTPTFPPRIRYDYIMVDIGKRFALTGDFSMFDYFRYISRVEAKTRATEVRVVYPDAFCNPYRTYELFYKFMKIAKRHWVKIYVAHNFWTVYDPPQEANVIALPARQQCDVKCDKYPGICARRIVDFLARHVEHRPIHLLGPAQKTLRYVVMSQQHFDSIDTTAYHRQIRSKQDKAKLTMFLIRWLIGAGISF